MLSAEANKMAALLAVAERLISGTAPEGRDCLIYAVTVLYMP